MVLALCMAGGEKLGGEHGFFNKAGEEFEVAGWGIWSVLRDFPGSPCARDHAPRELRPVRGDPAPRDTHFDLA